MFRYGIDDTNLAEVRMQNVRILIGIPLLERKALKAKAKSFCAGMTQEDWDLDKAKTEEFLRGFNG